MRNVRVMMLTGAFLSVMVLSNCGRLKETTGIYVGNRNEVAAAENQDFITSDPMFTVKDNVNPVVTSQPMFKMKRPEDRKKPKVMSLVMGVEETEWFKDIKRRMPKGYDVNHYKLKSELKQDNVTVINEDGEERIEGVTVPTTIDVDDMDQIEINEETDEISAVEINDADDNVAVLGISSKSNDADLYAVPTDDEVDEEYMNMAYDDSYKIVDDLEEVQGNVEDKLFFEHGSAKIKSADKVKIKTLSESLKSKKDEYKVSVVGHASKRVTGVADPVRKKAINFQIAKLRASNVKGEFRNNGVASEMIVTASKGDEGANPDVMQEANDRRVDIYLDQEQASN